MADNSTAVNKVQTVAEKLQTKTQKGAEALAARLALNNDESQWEVVVVPATDLFGEPHSGVSINFERFDPDKDEQGRHTGKEGRYKVDPEKATEIRRLLQQHLQAQMRILQPGQDKKMGEIMRRGGKHAASNAGAAEADSLGANFSGF